MSNSTQFVIVGGGPVGLNVALLLAKEGYRCTVYEGRAEIPNDPEESYPIGVNPRGLQALAAVDPSLAQQVRDTGRIVDSWQIFGGKRRVAKLDSGVVYGTSRSRVNLLLFERARSHPLITIQFQHKLVDIDFQTKHLVFRRYPTKETVRIDASGDTRVIAADGLNSAVRQAMVNQSQQLSSPFVASVTPWNYEFRVLFAPPGAEHPDMDTRVHYILNGSYTATVDNEGKQQWTCVMSSRQSDSQDSIDLRLSKEGTPENRERLRTMVTELAPAFASLLEGKNGDEEYKRYFTRRSYRGAIVSCNRLNEGEWILLLGDAAHSVLPPVGEGINSGLEDTMILVTQCVRKKLATCFSDFNACHLADVHAIYEYARYLNTTPWFSGEKIARTAFTILESSSSPNIAEYLFGPKGELCTPYSEIVARFQSRKRWQLPLLRVIFYPIAVVGEIVYSPFRFFYWLRSKNKNHTGLDRELKPPV